MSTLVEIITPLIQARKKHLNAVNTETKLLALKERLEVEHQCVLLLFAHIPELHSFEISSAHHFPPQTLFGVNGIRDKASFEYINPNSTTAHLPEEVKSLLVEVNLKLPDLILMKSIISWISPEFFALYSKTFSREVV